MERGVHALQKSYKIYNFTLTTSLHHLIKSINIKRYILKSIVTLFKQKCRCSDISGDILETCVILKAISAI